MARLLLNGKVPSKDELMGDDLVIQMIADATAEAVKTVPTKENVIQALTVEEVPEPIKQALVKDVPTKTTVMQSLTIEDVAGIPEVVKQKIVADAGIVPPVIQSFADQLISAVKADKGNGTINDKDKGNDVKQSTNRQLYNRFATK